MPATAPRALRAIAWLVPVLVLIQAVLAGQGWFQGADVFGLHGGIGHSVLLLTAAVAVWCWVARVGALTAGLATLVVVGVIGQTGLGYAGHRSQVAIASSLHIPLGTVILAATVAVALLLTVAVRVPGRDGARVG